ncbi:MAG: phytanoyl-CoA dioxygenase family protein [Chthonomonadales bacterium]|nr:phytanoyl-CoA dioxygenase family protein [Chthonomonadales bacterium]
MHGRLTPPEIERFLEEGYLCVPDLLRPSDLEPLREEIAGIVDATARGLLREGAIEEAHAGEGFETRLTRLLADRPDLAPAYFRAIEGKGGGGHAGRAMFNVITHPPLLDAVEDLVGPEIIGSSVYRIRPKVPGLNRGVVPWHQDSGYFAPTCDGHLVVTCWIPLVDSTPANGCLRMLPRTHGAGVLPHHTGGNAGFLVILDEDLPAPPEGAVAVPVPLGGVLFLTNLTPHCSTPNETDVIRWSVDLRYQGSDAPTNAFHGPPEVDATAPEVRMACYPPEADFVVRSRALPDSVTTFEEFAARRALYERAAIPGPRRGWQPVPTP